jgi:xylan 1,4-beta-xylosidase
LVVSDCDAVAVLYNPHNYAPSYTVAAAEALNAGTDLDCGTTYPNYLPSAYNQSLIEKATLVRAVTRLYTALVTVGWFDPPEDQPYRQLGWQDVNLPSSQALAYQAAVEGIVLIKNDGLLPLSTEKVKNVALIGPWANASTQMQSDYTVRTFFLMSIIMLIDMAYLGCCTLVRRFLFFHIFC